MVLELITGGALLLALSLLNSLNIRFWKERHHAAQLVAGVLFGTVCVLGMLMPVVVAPDQQQDARSVVLSMAAVFGGPLAGAIAGVLAGLFRIYLGGVGTGAGVAVIVLCVWLGMGYRYLVARGKAQIRVSHLLLFGLLLHTAVLVLSIQWPASLGTDLLGHFSWRYLAAFTLITLVLGLVLEDGVRRYHTERALRASEARFREMLQDIPGVSVQGYARDGTTRYWNKASERLYGYTAQEAIGRNLLDLIIAPPMRDGVRQAMQHMFTTQEVIPASELTLMHKDGSEVQVFSSHAYLNQPGRPPEMFCLDIDLSERMRADAELRIAAAAFEAQEGIMVTDPNRVILRVNQAFTAITGYSPEEAIGQTPSLLRSGRHGAAFFANMNERLQQQGLWAGEIWNRRKNGEVFAQSLRISTVRNAKGQVTHYVAMLTDITERKAAEEQIRQLAFFDPLTELPNRRLLMDRLQQALAASSRTASCGALLFIDLDHFKTLNDTLGHDKGDLLLKQVALRLNDCVREGDTVARLGGDEYVIMLEGLDATRETAAAQARGVGDKVVSRLNSAYSLDGFDYHSTPSVGVAIFSGHETSIEELLKQADLAMYQAKSAGRNRMRFFDPGMQAAVNERATLEADLRQGLEARQFLLHYQAQIDSQGRATGAEALLRWSHPQRGMVSPAHFIPLAEESGLILLLGNWVLEAACAQLVAWAGDPLHAHLSLAVNVSSRQFRERDFADYVLGLLDATGANPRRLKLELTESMLAENLQDIVIKMTALRERGVGFSLDDFGTGYSSLAYLKQLPLDQLKIDQSFVRDVLTDPNDAAIAKTIVALAHSLGLAVIAEGVETEEQRDFLLDNGCHAYQGYLFSRPLAPLDFERYLASI